MRFHLHGLTEGCLGCRSFAGEKRAQGHSDGCGARHEAAIAKSDVGRVRLTTAHLRGLARDEEKGPGGSAGAPPAIPVPPIPGEAQDAPVDDGAGARAPMDVIATSRKRSAEDAGNETDDADRGGVQADDCMPEVRREAACGTHKRSVLMLWHWQKRSRQRRFQRRAGAFGLSAAVAIDLRLEWDLGHEADQVKARKMLSVEKPHLLILSPTCLAFSWLQALNTKPDRLAELLKQGRHQLEFACCLARPQVDQGGRVLFEHHWFATSWKEQCLKGLFVIDGMRGVRCDQCQFGMTSVNCGACSLGDRVHDE